MVFRVHELRNVIRHLGTHDAFPMMSLSKFPQGTCLRFVRTRAVGNPEKARDPITREWRLLRLLAGRSGVQGRISMSASAFILAYYRLTQRTVKFRITRVSITRRRSVTIVYASSATRGNYLFTLIECSVAYYHRDNSHPNRVISRVTH